MSQVSFELARRLWITPGSAELHKLWSSKINQFIAGMEVIHPAVHIYVWICLALIAQILSGYYLVLLTGIVATLAFLFCRERFSALLRRSRWILLSVLIIYAYTGTGDLLWPQLKVLSPVAEGVVAGLIQTSRLLIMLACLSILLNLLSQTQLVTGIYTLFHPLQYLGLARERIAVRLALTMRYAESAMQGGATDWRRSIEHTLAPVMVVPGFVELHDASFSNVDRLLLVACLLVVVSVILL